MSAPAGGARPGPGAWALLAGLLAAEALLFTFAARPVARAWPRRFDQATYLARTYELHERMREAPFLRAAGEFVRAGMPNGVLLPLEAAALFRLAGPSRPAALAVNFAHYAALAVALFLAASGLTGRAATGFVAVGLLVLARTPFHWPGGLLDFRFDFAGACLYGIFLCAVLASRGLVRPGLAALAGFAAGACIATRFLTVAYLAGLFGVVTAALAFAFARGVMSARVRLRGLAVAALVAGAVAGPLVWLSRGAISVYYVGQQFGDLGRARAAMDFNRGLLAFLAYYPYTALLRHAGPPVLAFAAVLAFLLWRAREAGTANPRPDLRVAALGIAAACAVPAAVLTLGPQRQPDVASILLAPILFACLLPAVAWGGSRRGRLLERAGAALALALGLLLQAGGVAHAASDPDALRDAAEVARLHDAAFAAMRRAGIVSPLVSVDRITDAFDATIFEAYAFERNGVLVRARHGLGASLLEMPDEEAFAALAGSDLVLLTRAPAPKLLVFPFTRQMERLAPELAAFCASRLVSEGLFHYGGGEVELFRRP